MEPDSKFLIIIGVAILTAGGLGAIKIKANSKEIAYLHYGLATVFILLSVGGIYFQYKRVKLRKKIDWVVWLHIVLFSVLIYLSSSAVAYHYRKMVKMHGGIALSNEAPSYKVSYEGKNYDLEPFLKNHPGGRTVIQQALEKPGRPMELKEIWKYNGVPWHDGNANVMDYLKKYEI
jgi:hypothetical protein